MSTASFARVLNDYCNGFSCSNKELAELCGISASSLSRYRRGERVPDPEGDAVRKIAQGLATLTVTDPGQPKLDEKSIRTLLVSSIESSRPNVYTFRSRLDDLMRGLSITNAEMARHTHVDPSFLSRIRNGQRFPAEPETYARSFSTLIARRSLDPGMEEALLRVAGPSEALKEGLDAHDQAAIASLVQNWLLEDEPRTISSVEHFLGFLDEFDLNSYIQAIHYDELKVPTMPMVVPTSRSYYGVQQMRAAELEFLKVTATSRNAREVTMFSDMSLTELVEDPTFMKSYVMGVGAMLKRGVRLNIVHDLTRPFDEMMVGLEGWIPLYMTGQVHPYYLKGERDRVFGHLWNASDVAVLTAESVRGHHNEGRYCFSTKREDVAYGMRRARLLLERAVPLMEIIPQSDAERFAQFQRDEQVRKAEGGVRIGADVFRNMTIMSYESDLVVICKQNEPRINFVIRHPRLCDAIAHMTPAVVE